jgi:opine dehydrogenase
VAIVGAGAIGRAYAALLARDGHAVALWSPSGASVAGLPSANGTMAPWADQPARTLNYTGAASGSVTVATPADPAAIARAEVVIVALPAPAYAPVLPRVVPHLRTAQTVIVSGALSLVPLWLAELAAAQGQSPLVAAFGTTVATARTRDDGVAIMTLRTRLGVAAIPSSAGERAREVCRRLFGERFDAVDDVLAITLTNINPVAHAGLAIGNVTRIERAEAWPQYHYMTPAVSRLIEALDAERRAIAAGFGVTVRTIEEHFQRSFDVPQARLADIAAELHRRRGGPPGPTDFDTRFVLEDAPFGLVCNAELARIAGVPVPATAAAITVLSNLWGRDLRLANPLLAALGLDFATRLKLQQRCSGTAGSAR